MSRQSATPKSTDLTAPETSKREATWRGRWSRWRQAARRVRWLGFRRASGLRGRVAGLREHDDELTKLAAAMERKFLAIGEALQAQAGSSAQLVEQSSRLLALGASQGGEAPIAERAAALVQEMLDFVEETRGQTESLIAKVEGYHQQIGRLLYEEQRVERIVAPLRVIQTLFRIESAVLPMDVQMAFVALSGEIPKFEAKVREAFAQHSELLTRTRDQIERTAAGLREAAALQAQAVAATRERTRETLTAIERELVESRRRDGRLESLVREIDAEAGAVVVSLQYQDITRQKMDHVRKAVDEIVERSDGAGRFRGANDVAYLHQACRLEALQTEAIHGDLANALTTLLRGVKGMVGRLDQIERECRPRADFGRAAETVEHHVRSLKEALQQAELLVPEVLQGATGALALLNSFGDVAASVAATASEMAEDMRMIALNAQVQAAQAGDAGAGLLILAERTYLISEEIKLVTRNIGTEFAEAARLLGDAKEEGGWLRQETETRRGTLTAGGDRVREELENYRAESGRTLGRIEGLLREIERQAAKVLPELEIQETWSAPLLNLRDELAGIAADIAPFVEHDAAGRSGDDTFAHVQRRYTMDAERAVHASAFAAAGTAVAAPAEPAPADSNVELF